MDRPAYVFRDLQRRFDRAAPGFDGTDFLHRQSFGELLERLEPVLVQPRTVLDLGCASGAGSRQLARHYRRSRVIGLDASISMLREGRRKRTLFYKPSVIQADARRIPLQEGSIDLVFANMLLPCIDDLALCLSEVSRVLCKGGVFAFATLGPDSLSELRDAWRTVDNEWHVGAFPDMHDIGDAIVRAGLRDPVLDVDHLNVTYHDTHALYRDLTSAGARNSLRGRRRTLTGKSRFTAMDKVLSSGMEDNVLSLRLELVYGHAWGGGPRPTAGEVRINLHSITQRGR